jgi:hypothetical protein
MMVSKDWNAVARQDKLWKPLLPSALAESTDSWQHYMLLQRVVQAHTAQLCPFLLGLDSDQSSIQHCSMPAAALKGHWLEAFQQHGDELQAAKWLVEQAEKASGISEKKVPHLSNMVRRLGRLRATAAVN